METDRLVKSISQSWIRIPPSKFSLLYISQYPLPDWHEVTSRNGHISELAEKASRPWWESFHLLFYAFVFCRINGSSPETFLLQGIFAALRPRRQSCQLCLEAKNERIHPDFVCPWHLFIFKHTSLPSATDFLKPQGVNLIGVAMLLEWSNHAGPTRVGVDDASLWNMWPREIKQTGSSACAAAVPMEWHIAKWGAHHTVTPLDSDTEYNSSDHFTV